MISNSCSNHSLLILVKYLLSTMSLLLDLINLVKNSWLLNFKLNVSYVEEIISTQIDSRVWVTYFKKRKSSHFYFNS